MTKEEIREKATRYCETLWRHHNSAIVRAFAHWENDFRRAMEE